MSPITFQSALETLLSCLNINAYHKSHCYCMPQDIASVMLMKMVVHSVRRARMPTRNLVYIKTES